MVNSERKGWEMSQSEQLDAQVERMSDDRGASFVEYALLIALIVMVCFSAMTVLGNQTHDRLDNTASQIDAAS